MIELFVVVDVVMLLVCSYWVVVVNVVLVSIVLVLYVGKVMIGLLLF